MKELYNNVIRVFDDLPPKGVIYRKDQGVKLLGNSATWDETHKWISHNVPHRIILPGVCDLSVQNPDGLERVRQQLAEEIKNIERADRSQRLADRNNLSSIFSNWTTFVIALWGAITGSIAVLNQIFKWF